MGRTPFYDILWPSIGGYSKDFKQNPGDIPPSKPHDAIGALYCALVSVALHLRPGHVTRWCGWELGAGGKETHVARLSLTVLVGRLHSTNMTITLTYSDYDKSAWFTLLTSLYFKVPKRSERRIPLKLVAIMFRRLTPHRPSLNWQALSIS